MERMNYPELVKTVLTRNTENHRLEVTEKELIFDSERNSYLVVHVAWNNNERAYGTIIHVDIRDGKIWIQRDLTEEGVASALVELGVPKTDIVLGFKSPFLREFTGFAVG
ncbi:MAG: XisI protein [Sphaerospermopsis sp. SIO1G1]|nr:XisI protein [Sphaerospermopsis sp. SIO1G1]